VSRIPERWNAMPPLVEILWEDHYSIGDDWYDPDHPHVPCILAAIGYLVNEDEMYYYVACTYELDSGRYSAGTAVLKNCVIGFRKYALKDADDDVSKIAKKTSSAGKKVPAKRSRTRM